MDPVTVWTIISLHLLSTGALLFLIAARTPSDRGLRAFGAASVVTALAYSTRLATGMLVSPTGVSFVSGVLLIAAMLMMYSGVRQYVGQSAISALTYAKVLGLFLLARGLAWYSSDTVGGLVALNGSLALGYTVIAWTAVGAALRMRRDSSGAFAASLWAFAALVIALGLAGYVRSAQAMFMPETLFKGPLANAFYGVMAVGAMLMCPALVWLAFERLTAQLARMAAHDPLTGLLNRKGLTDAMAHHFASRSPASVAVLMLDIDHFKRVNDAHGHPAGDDVLREVSQRVRALLRPSDWVARVGGEEILVVCPGVDAAGAAQLAERMRSAVGEQTVQLVQATTARSVAVTVSVGVSAGADSLAAFDRAWKQADAALYGAKSAGRNRVMFGSADSWHLAGPLVQTTAWQPPQQAS